MSKHLTRLAMVGLIALAAACGGSSSSDNNNGGGSSGGGTSGGGSSGGGSYTGMMLVTTADYGTFQDVIGIGTQAIFSVGKDYKYAVEITAASVPAGQNIQLKVSQNGGSYGNYLRGDLCTLTATPTACKTAVLDNAIGDGADARLVIDMGNNAANSTIYLKDAKVIEYAADGTTVRTQNLLTAEQSSMSDPKIWATWAYLHDGGSTGTAPTLTVAP